ncbi:MAG: tyrosine-protein phosphatase [Bacteroidales bacterium]|nr:tyrosine-protein phosphatase [Bacteroidales bacterium]
MKVFAKLLISMLPLIFACSKTEAGITIPNPPKPDSGTTTGTGSGSGSGTDKTFKPAEAPAPFIIVGYATYWDTTMPDPSLLTHINYSFAHIKGDFESLDIKNESRLAKIAALKKTHPGLSVSLSVGGWGAGNFSEMAASEEHRKTFCQNCLAAVKKYNLDGIDLDWEYPTSDAAGISHSPEDTKNFTLLLKDLRFALGDGKYITMASADNAKYVDFAECIDYLNWVNVMTYDMGEPPYHNAGLYKSSKTYRSCEESIGLHFKAGVPYGKMTLGIPFFGHGDGKAFTSESIDYRKISPIGYTVKWDNNAQVPYLADNAGNMVLTYDDATSVGLKADFVKSKGLLGAMYWNIEADDDTWTLSTSVAQRLLPGFDPSLQDDAIQVTNPYVQKYMEEVKYPDREYTYTVIKNYPGGGPGENDIPPAVTISWDNGAYSDAIRLQLWDDEWSRTWSLAPGTNKLDVSNLVPGSHYTFLVTDYNGNVIAKGGFNTKGALHQVYFDNKVRNGRDLGGWKTTDGKTVRFRKIYRGGRVDSKYMSDAGRKEAVGQGIKAELDLREAEDVPKSSYFGSSMAFFAPGFDSGYKTMLRDRADAFKDCFCFVVNCLREDKPVYFHCAAGRDRTGTLALVLLGVLGVPEGDLGKDYELTYFSPADWSMYKNDYQHVRTASSYSGAVEYIWTTGASGNDFKTRTENYLLHIGVLQKDIDDFRAMMLK